MPLVCLLEPSTIATAYTKSSKTCCRELSHIEATHRPRMLKVGKWPWQKNCPLERKEE